MILWSVILSTTACISCWKIRKATSWFCNTGFSNTAGRRWPDQRFPQSSAPCSYVISWEFLQCRRPDGLGPKGRELSGLDEIEYCVEPKFDGASISLLYEDDMFTRGATRGDGETGDDITPNIKLIRSVPLSAAFSRYDIRQIEIRGEVLMNKHNFKKYNDKLIEEGMPPLANPRMPAGSLRIKTNP